MCSFLADPEKLWPAQTKAQVDRVGRNGSRDGLLQDRSASITSSSSILRAQLENRPSAEDRWREAKQQWQDRVEKELAAMAANSADDKEDSDKENKERLEALSLVREEL